MRAPLVYAIPASFLFTSLALRIFLAQAPPSVAHDLQQPLVVATSWHAFGGLMWSVACSGIILALAGYVAILQSIQKNGAPDPSASVPKIVLLAAAALAAALSLPVVFSSDVYAYAAYGWMDANGISPYAHSILPAHDALIRAAIWQWSNPLPVCVYGPAFVWVAKIIVVGTAQFGTAMQLLALRAVACLCLLACGPLLYSALGEFRKDQRLLAVAGVLLNPVVIWSAAEGHNDAMMLAVVLLGFAAIRKFGYLLGSFVIASSALVKASGAAAAAVLFLFAWPSRGRLVKLACGFACGIALTAIVARPFESGIRSVLIPHGHYAPQFSAQYMLAQIAAALFGTGTHTQELAIAMTLVACGLVGLYGARLALRGDLRGAGYLCFALWLAIPNPYPWYALWILPVAFICARTPIAWTIVVASITIFARYLPDVSAWTSDDTNIIVTLCELALPLIILASQATWPQRSRALEGDTTA